MRILHSEVVTVVMSTYNGEAYLWEQIESIVSQEGVSLHLFIRDDGSSDGTLGILREAVARYPEVVSYDLGENVGWKRSFLLALAAAPRGDFYAFADQDDVWLSGKMLRAVEMLDSRSCLEDDPKLYVSNSTVCDCFLNPIGFTHAVPLDPMEKSKGELFVENEQRGLTFVFNEKLRQLVLRVVDPGAKGHDWWTSVLARAFGSIVYDYESFVLYRQHDANAVGATPGFLARLKNWIKIITSPGDLSSTCANTLLNVFGDELQDDEFEKFLKTVRASKKSIRNRVSLLGCSDFHRSCPSGTMILRVRTLLGKY